MSIISISENGLDYPVKRQRMAERDKKEKAMYGLDLLGFFCMYFTVSLCSLCLNKLSV